MSAGGRRIVLAGNPNVGKSALFNALTGLYVEVSNFPGTTVEISSARLGPDLLLDTPGVYGLSSFTDEERVARDVILTADVVIDVVDAVHLERDLFLTLQLTELGLPVVVALNMVDELASRGLAVDHLRLAELLGVAVFPTVAVRGRGISRLKYAAAAATRPRDGEPAGVLQTVEDPGNREGLYLERRRRADAIARQVRRRLPRSPSVSSTLAGLTIHPWAGPAILGVVLAGLYYLIGQVVAQRVVDFTEKTVVDGYFRPMVEAAVASLFAPGSLAGSLLAGEFGALTMGLGYLLGLILPLVTGFYLALGVLEDSGYLPRVAVLADRALVRLGLNGRAIIPLILGFGCVTMATVTTRILSTRRERTIATFLLALTIPCSAQLGVIASILTPLGPGYLAAYAAAMLGPFAFFGAALDRLLPGESYPLLAELPPLRVPGLGNLLRKTASRSYWFIREAGSLFIIGALLIASLQYLGVLGRVENWLAPVTEGWLGLPREAAVAFLMGMIRRDFGAARLLALGLGPSGSLVAMVTITLFVPCVASIAVILKERGGWEGLVIWVASLLTAFSWGGIIHRLLSLGGG